MLSKRSMGKQKNRLYSNPANAKSFPAGTKIVVGQSFKLDDRKVMLEAVVYPENLFLQFSEINEKNAVKQLGKIKNKLQGRKYDLPMIEEGDGKVEFLHNSFSVIIYSYCAIETYVNSYIDKYKIELKGKKRYSLQEKLNFVLDNLGLDKIEYYNLQIWNNFLEIEELRDKIIHSKFSYYNIEDPFWSDLLISKIFNGKFKGKTLVAYNIIEYMKSKEPKNNGNVLHIGGRGLQSNPI